MKTISVMGVIADDMGMQSRKENRMGCHWQGTSTIVAMTQVYAC